MAGRKTAKQKLVSTSEFARMMNVTRQAVLGAIANGRLSAEKVDGVYQIDPVLGKDQFLNSKERQVVNDPNGTGTQVENLTHLKRIRLGLQIQQDKLNLEKSKGELVSVREVNDKLFKMGMELRQAFQMLPSQVIDDILAANSRNEAHEILSAAIDRELQKLSSLEI